MSDNPIAATTPGAGSSPAQQALAAETQAENTTTGSFRVPVKGKYITLLLLAMFGAYVALVAPIAISLSLRVQELVPANVEIQGYIIGIAAIATTITGPLMGLWSDRLRSRFGRRRPFAIGGATVGFIGLIGLAAAVDVPTLMIAWVVTSFGWSTSMNSLIQSQADRLPEAQYGKVAGMSGFVQMAAPVFGAGLASAFIGSNFLVFLVPGAIGLVTMLIWVLFVSERDARDFEAAERLSIGHVFGSMVFNPRKYPDFAWNWLARLLFMTGVTFTTTFTTLFFASRLSESGQVSEIGGIIVILSMVSLVATGGGALFGGFLSDKIKRRRIFVLFSGVVYTAGAITLAFGGSNFAILLTGSFLTGLGLGIFSAVDQAIVLNVLPEKDTDAGRFLGINGYSTSIAQAIAPIAAAPLILIGATGDDKNYGLLFIIASVLTILAGIIVQARVRSVR